MTESFDAADMIERTRLFALRVLKLCSVLHGSYEKETIGSQLFRCATSIAAHYLSNQYAQSSASFYRNLKVCEEEADETAFWLNFLSSSHLVNPSRLESLTDEAHQIASIIGASCITLSRNRTAGA